MRAHTLGHIRAISFWSGREMNTAEGAGDDVLYVRMLLCTSRQTYEGACLKERSGTDTVHVWSRLWFVINQSIKTEAWQNKKVISIFSGFQLWTTFMEHFCQLCWLHAAALKAIPHPHILCVLSNAEGIFKNKNIKIKQKKLWLHQSNSWWKLRHITQHLRDYFQCSRITGWDYNQHRLFMLEQKQKQFNIWVASSSSQNQEELKRNNSEIQFKT